MGPLPLVKVTSEKEFAGLQAIHNRGQLGIGG